MLAYMCVRTSVRACVCVRVWACGRVHVQARLCVCVDSVPVIVGYAIEEQMVV